jgi:hypothetical protein
MIIRIFAAFVTMVFLVCHDLCTWQTARSQRGCERLYYMVAWRTHLGMCFKPAFHITNVGMYTQPSSFRLQGLEQEKSYIIKARSFRHTSFSSADEWITFQSKYAFDQPLAPASAATASRMYTTLQMVFCHSNFRLFAR